MGSASKWRYGRGALKDSFYNMLKQISAVPIAMQIPLFSFA